MANAKMDQNSRPTLICASSVDGTTIVPIKANATNHGLQVSDASTGSDNGNNSGVAMLDENSVPVLTCMSSSNDGTIIEVYGSAGSLLIDSS